MIAVSRTDSYPCLHGGLPRWHSGKESACNSGDAGSIPGSGRSLGRGKWQCTPVFLPGKSHEQRSLAGYSPWGRKALAKTARTHDFVELMFYKVYLKELDFPCTKHCPVVGGMSYDLVPIIAIWALANPYYQGGSLDGVGHRSFIHLSSRDH